MPNHEFWIEIDSQGRLVLPPEVAAHYGILPAGQVLLQENSKGLHLQRPPSQLARVYLEPTSRCNLVCRTCIRNAWDEPQGDMTAETFGLVLENIKKLPSPPEVFFGGFGEPLLLPNIAGMVAQARAVAAKVELITNGTLLTEQCTRQLIEAGLDTLWVSIDGATAEAYADVRLGAALPGVLENMRRIAILRHGTTHRLEVGISFVAMRRNIADLPVLIRMGPQLGVSRFLVTNVFPYTQELCAEMLYARSVDGGTDTAPSPWSPGIDLPRMDLNDASQEALLQTLRYRNNVTWNGANLGQQRGRCPFIQSGSIVINWEGNVSPCLALMHSYPTYLHGQKRSVRRQILGTLADRDLGSIWGDPDYLAFRKRLQEFDFAPCTWCGGCEMAEKNEEDCFSNTFPTCGGCLWAQGVIQCP